MNSDHGFRCTGREAALALELDAIDDRSDRALKRFRDCAQQQQRLSPVLLGLAER